MRQDLSRSGEEPQRNLKKVQSVLKKKFNYSKIGNNLKLLTPNYLDQLTLFIT
jgi:hypothetical protein